MTLALLLFILLSASFLFYRKRQSEKVVKDIEFKLIKFIGTSSLEEKYLIEKEIHNLVEEKYSNTFPFNGPWLELSTDLRLVAESKRFPANTRFGQRLGQDVNQLTRFNRDALLSISAAIDRAYFLK